jgi:hypothetical protein
MIVLFASGPLSLRFSAVLVSFWASVIFVFAH